MGRQWPIQHVPSYTTIHGLAEVEQEDDLTKLLEITCGYFEKLEDGNPKRIGPWQLLCWQPRWCQAERDGFCFQPVSTTEVTAHTVASKRSTLSSLRRGSAPSLCSSAGRLARTGS